MQLRAKEELFKKWDHTSHYIILSLVGIALITSLVPAVSGAAPLLDETLHIIHLAALAIALLQTSLFLVLKRNVGKEIAQALNKDRSYNYRHLKVVPEKTEFVAASSTGSL